MRILTALALSLGFFFCVDAKAGSVGNSSSSFAGVGCNNRANEVNCTYQVREDILNKCYVIVHEDKLPSCTWQSCGYLSIINDRPFYRNGELDEYGFKTKIARDPSWGCDSGGNNCVPKSGKTFRRHYLTVRDALLLRNSSDNSSIAQKLKSIDQSVLDANPYLRCALKTDANVRLWYGLVSSNPFYNKTILVQQSKVNEMCDLLRRTDLKDKAAYCHVGGDDWGNGAVKLKEFKAGQ
jgi:hypothetical protein